MKGRVFAIRLGAWVELRVATEPPKRRASSFKRSGVRQEYDWEKVYPFPLKDVPFTVTIKVVAHEGGRRLCAMKLPRFQQLTNLPALRVGGMVELSPEM